jgi:MmyB-like transcription regulator ligand binding domain
MHVLDRLDDTPAMVHSDLVDTLAMNPLAVALLGDQTRHTGLARSGYYRWFMDPAERLLYPEETHESHGRAHAARLRAALTAGSDTPRAARILAELQQHSTEFVRMWERQEVAHRYDDCKIILHPELGRIDVDGQVLFTENRAQALVVLTTRPGTESHSKLELLSVVGHQQLTR